MYLRAWSRYKILRNFDSSIHHWKKKFCFIRRPRGWGFDSKWPSSRPQDRNDLVNLTKDEDQDFFHLRDLQGRYGTFNSKLLTREQLLVDVGLSWAHRTGSSSLIIVVLYFLYANSSTCYLQILQPTCSRIPEMPWTWTSLLSRGKPTTRCSSSPRHQRSPPRPKLQRSRFPCWIGSQILSARRVPL